MPREIKDSKHFEDHYKSVLEYSMTKSEVTQSDAFELADITAINQAVNEPVYDLLNRGGKQWRPLMGLMLAECFGRDL